MMKKIAMLALAMGIGAVSGQVKAQTAISAADTTSVAVGTVFGEMMSQQINQFRQRGLSIDNDVFLQALGKAMRGEPTGMTVDEADVYMQRQFRRLMAEEQAARALDVSAQQAFVDSLASTDGAVKTATGLVFKVLTEGEGANPTDEDVVMVKYSGRLSDGTVFDDSGERVVELPISHLIPGFSEGLKMMKPGGTYRIIIPASLGYGAQGAGADIPGNAALDFTVTLEGIKAK